LTLSRPDSLNAMSPEMIGELALAAGWLADRAPLRGLIVTGAGRAFSSGGDVNWFKQGVDDADFDLPSDVRRGAEVLHQAIVDFRRIPYPVIAAVNGVAAGAGFSLALMCDIRIASVDAAFVCAYGRIGASPDGGMTYFLPRVVGPSKALELLLNDPVLSAEQALELGIVSRVVAAGDLLGEAKAKAEKLAAKAPHYVRMAKLLVGQSLDNSLTEHLQVERHGIADSMATEDLREGVTAFFEGREPTFTGS
jgi:2-(1,2-epoxy-1,2-dihydrophenyl)acetyl-CoA isomerase